MKNKIKIFTMIAAIVLCVFGMTTNVFAAEGRTVLSVSAESVEVGDTITVTAKVVSDAEDSMMYATMTLGYDTNMFELVSCSADYGGGNGSVVVSSDSFTVELKTIHIGEGGLTLSAIDGMDLISGAEFANMQESSATIMINHAPNSVSSDSSLQSLELSAGTLAPEFQRNILSYTAKVDYDVKKVAINAKPADAAKVTSVTGNTNLQVGVNTVEIEVTAESGDVTVYRIDITRAEEKTTETETETTQTETETSQTETETTQTEKESEASDKENIDEEIADKDNVNEGQNNENQQKSSNTAGVFLILAGIAAGVMFLIFKA